MVTFLMPIASFKTPMIGCTIIEEKNEAETTSETWLAE